MLPAAENVAPSPSDHSAKSFEILSIAHGRETSGSSTAIERAKPEADASIAVTSVDHGEEDDAEVVHQEDAVADDVDDEPLYRAPPTSNPQPPTSSGYKPGTRQLPAATTKTKVGEPPWWASKDPKVWAERQQQMHNKGVSTVDNLIGWKNVGTSSAVGKRYS